MLSFSIEKLLVLLLGISSGINIGRRIGYRRGIRACLPYMKKEPLPKPDVNHFPEFYRGNPVPRQER